MGSSNLPPSPPPPPPRRVRSAEDADLQGRSSSRAAAVASERRKEESRQSSARGRFRLSTALACTTAVAVGLAIATQAPLLWELAIGALWAAGGSWIALGLLYTRGERQAFYVGAALMYTSMWTGFGGQFVQAMRGVVQVLGGGFQGSRALTSTLDLGLVAGAAYANGKFAQWCWKKFFEKAPKSH